MVPTLPAWPCLTPIEHPTPSPAAYTSAMTTRGPLASPAARARRPTELARSWRRLTRVATVVAVMTAPALFVWFTQQNGWSWWVSLLAALASRDRLPRLRGSRLPQADPVAEPLRRRERRAARGRRRRPAPRVVLALLVQGRAPRRDRDHDHLDLRRRHVVGRGRDDVGQHRDLLTNPRCGCRSSSSSSSSSRTSRSCSARC